ncbi:MAG: T9SS type A sorting domain-containing protein [Saprospiraceae bacterium]
MNSQNAFQRKFGRLFLLILLAILNFSKLPAQLTLSCNETTTIGALTSDDLIIPVGITSLSVEVTGADGGNVKLNGDICGNKLIKGGAGAKVSATFSVGGTDSQLQPGGKLRVFVGSRGESSYIACIDPGNVAGAGGGSSAVLYLPPGMEAGGQNWRVLAVAGGGGGANRPHPGYTYEGQGANAGESGDDTGQSKGGTNGDCGESGKTFPFIAKGYGGGGVNCQREAQEMGGSMATEASFSSGILLVKLRPNSEITSQTGGTSSSGVDGGDGFTGGALGNLGGGGGGGGGYSGGAGVSGQEGGGGGSYVTSGYGVASVTKTSGDNGAGNSRNGEVNIRTVGPTTPQALCKNLTLTADANGSFPTLTPADIDNGSFGFCGAPISLAFGDDTQQVSYSCNLVFSSPRLLRLKVTEIGSGATSTCYSTITLVDNLAPTASCKDATIQIRENGKAYLTFEDVNSNSLDNCRVTAFDLSQLTFDCSMIGPNTVTLKVWDYSGHSATCQAKVTVEDTTPPAASCENVTVELDANGKAYVSPSRIGGNTTDNCHVAEMTLSQTDFDCSQVGDNTVTLSATDGKNTSTCTAIVTVVDNIPPTVSCKNITVELGVNGVASIAPSEISDNITDNCNFLKTILSPRTFTCSHLGDNTVTLIAADRKNISTCTATVTVVDNIKPTAICKTSLVASLDANGQATVQATDLDNGSTDNCSETLNFFFPDGSTQIDFDCSDVNMTSYYSIVVVDGSLNQGACYSQVFVRDEIAPIARCKDVTIELDASGQALYPDDIINDGSSDNCGIVSVQTQTVILTCADIGSFQATFTATDASGNSSSCTGTITVADKIAPSAVCQNISVELDANGVATITPSQVDGGSTDNCGIASMSLSETEMTCTYAYFGNRQVTLTVIDLSGNTATCKANVSVQDNIPATAVCQDITVYLDDNGQVTVDDQTVDGGSYDNCRVDYLSLSQTSFDCSDVGANPVSLYVADPGGAGSSCDAVITVVDNTPPVVVCQDITVQLNANGNASISAADVDAGSADNCGIGTTILDISSFSCDEIGANSVMLSVTDQVGNNSTCSATVTVEDAERPQLSANLDFQFCLFDQIGDLYQANFSASDNCDTDLHPTGVIAIPQLTNFLINFKTSSTKKLQFKLNQNRIIVFAPGSGGAENWWQQILAQGGVEIGQGQEIELEKPDDPNNIFYFFSKEGVLQRIISNSLTLNVGVRDAAGNETFTTATANRQCNDYGDPANGMGDEENQYAISTHIYEQQSSIEEGLLVPPFHTKQMNLEAFPNPFQSELTIQFNLPEAGRVSLQVFNLQGQLIQRLYDGALDAGEHQRQWDGSSERSQSLPSGIYLVQLRTEEGVITKKVVLQRL